MPTKTRQSTMEADYANAVSNVSRSASDAGGGQHVVMRDKQGKKSPSKTSRRKTTDVSDVGRPESDGQRASYALSPNSANGSKTRTSAEGRNSVNLNRDSFNTSRPRSQVDNDAIIDDESEPIDTEHQRVEKRQLKNRKSFIDRMRSAWRNSTTSLKRTNSLNKLSFSNLFGSSRKHRGSNTSLRNANAENITDVGKLDGLSDSDVLECTVSMLDGQSHRFRIDKRECLGVDIFNAVTAYLNLAEKEYFGLIYFDNRQVWHWLMAEKKVSSQLHGYTPYLEFQCRFYPIDPRVDLKEDLSRYYLTLQVRQNVLSGKLPCSFVTLSILGAYAAQADLGDQSEFEAASQNDSHKNAGEPQSPQPSLRISSGEYLKDYPLAPTGMQTAQLLEKTSELHRTMRGMMPDDCDLAFLDEARKLALYGMDLHRARDERGVEVMLGINGHGIVIYRDRVRLHTYTWPRIIKVSYRRTTVSVTLRGDQFGVAGGWRSVDSRADLTTFLDSAVQNGKRTDPEASFVETFRLRSFKLAKRCWRTVVEQHGFFRLRTPDLPVPPKRPLIKRFASSMRDLTGAYNGTTQAQLRERELNREQPDVRRSSSIRHSGGALGSWASLTSLRRSQSLLLRPQSPNGDDTPKQVSANAKAKAKPLPPPPPQDAETTQRPAPVEDSDRDADQDIESIAMPQSSAAGRVMAAPTMTPSATFHAETTVQVPPIAKRRKSKTMAALADAARPIDEQLASEQYREMEMRVLKSLNERHAAIKLSEADQIDRSELLLIKQKSTAKVVYVDEDGDPVDGSNDEQDEEDADPRSNGHGHGYGHGHGNGYQDSDDEVL